VRLSPHTAQARWVTSGFLLPRVRLAFQVRLGAFALDYTPSSTQSGPGFQPSPFVLAPARFRLGETAILKSAGGWLASQPARRGVNSCPALPKFLGLGALRSCRTMGCFVPVLPYRTSAHQCWALSLSIEGVHDSPIPPVAGGLSLSESSSTRMALRGLRRFFVWPSEPLFPSRGRLQGVQLPLPLASLVAGSLGWGSRGGRSLVRSAPFGSAQFWPYSWQVLASARPPGFLGAVWYHTTSSAQSGPILPLFAP
jgi:hypothetical protein